MATRTVTRVAITPPSTVVSFVEGALDVSTYVVEGTLIAQSDNSVLPFNTETNVSSKTVTGFTVSTDTASWFSAIVSSYGSPADDPDLASNAIVTLAQVKAYLNIASDDTTYDAFLKSKINVVSDWIERETNSKIILRDISEIVNGEGYSDYDAPSKPVYRIGIDSGMGNPIASDGFSTTPTDGLGHSHSEFIGLGGSGLAWTVQGEQATRSGGHALSTLNGDSLETVDVDESDCIVEGEFTLAVAPKTGGLLLRYSSSSNYIKVYISTASTVKVDKIVSGVTTNLVSEAITYVAGAKLKAVCDGSKVRVYYNGTQVGSEVNVHNFTTATKFGFYLQQEDADNYIDNFVVYSRLDAIQYRVDTSSAWQRVETSDPSFLYVSPGGCYLATVNCIPKGRSNVLLHYVAGYDTVPAKLEEIAIEAVAQIYNESPVGGGAINGSGRSFNQTGGSISGGQTDLGVLNGLRARFRHELDSFTFGRFGERL